MKLSIIFFLCAEGAHIVCAGAAESRPAAPDWDRLPAGAVLRLGSLDLKHAHAVASVSWSPDGKFVASGSTDGVVVIWDAATRKPLRILTGQATQGGPNPTAFSPDGKLFATGHANQTSIVLWNTSTWEKIGQLDGHTDVITKLLFSPDGKTLASGSTEYDSNTVSAGKTTLVNDYSVRLWDVAARRQRFQLSGHNGGIHALAWSPDGTKLASGSWDGGLFLWDPATGRVLHRDQPGEKENRSSVLGVLFTDDAKVLLYGGLESGIRSRDVASFTELTGPGRRAAEEVADLVLHRQKGLLAACCRDIVVSNADTLQPLRRMKTDSYFANMAFSPDGTTIVSGAQDNAVRFWDVARGEEKYVPAGHQKEVLGIAFSPDGGLLASSGRDGKIILWDLKLGMEIRRISREHSAHLSWNKTGLVSEAWHEEITTWNTDTGAEIKVIPSRCERIRFSPDESRLTGLTRAGDVALMDAATGAVLQIAEKDRTPENTGQSIGDEKVYNPNLQRAVFYPDGESVVTTSYDGEIFLWNLKTNRLAVVVDKTTVGDIRHEATAVSPDGRFVASVGERGAAVWERASGSELLKIPEKNGYKCAIAFLPDSRRMAVSGDEDGISLVNVLSGRVMVELPGHRWDVGCARTSELVFSPDSQTLASGGREGTVLLWKVPETPWPGDLLSEIELDQAWAALSGEPRQAYGAAEKLIQAPVQAIALLRLKLQMGPPTAALAALWRDLDDDKFKTRENAERWLGDYGSLARTMLTAHLEKNEGSPEAQRRTKQILTANHATVSDPEILRYLRANLVLEKIATKDAEELLASLSSASLPPAVTQDARASLARLQERKKSKSR